MDPAGQPPEGCDYCQDPANRLFDGVGDPTYGLVLLEGPRCGQYYMFHGFEPHYRPALTQEDAARRFPEEFRHGPPKLVG